MAYMIQYEGDLEKQFENPARTKLNVKRLLLPLCLGLIVITFLVKPARAAIFDLLFPGDSEVTFRAAENMIDDINSGQNFRDAFSDFCVEILTNA